MTLKVLLIPKVLASGFTFLANHVASGLPSLTALTGLGESIALQCTRAGLPTQFNAVSLALRAPATNMGHSRFLRSSSDERSDLESALGDKENKKSFASPTISDLKGSVLLDILVVLEIDDASFAGVPEELMARVARAQRFSGGTLNSLQGTAVQVQVFDSLTSALSRMPGSALMLEDASDALKTFAAKSGQSLKTALLELITAHRTAPVLDAGSAKEASADEPANDEPAADETVVNEPADDSTDTSDTSDNAGTADTLRASAQEDVCKEVVRPAGYFVPAATGFALLETPRVKADSRAAGVPHAYAEPLLGLVRVRQVASVRAQLRRSMMNFDDEARPAVFWHTAFAPPTPECPFGATYANGVI